MTARTLWLNIHLIKTGLGHPGFLWDPPNEKIQILVVIFFVLDVEMA